MDKEKIAFICTQSLINICKDLKSIDEPVLAGLCLFAAKTLAEKAPDVPQIHQTAEKAHETVKEEIAAAVEVVNYDTGFRGDGIEEMEKL